MIKIKSKWHLRKESDQISLNLAESIPQAQLAFPLPVTNKAAEKTTESTLKAHEKKLRKEFGKIFPHK